MNWVLAQHPSTHQLKFQTLQSMSLDVWVSGETVRLWCYCGNTLSHWGWTGFLVYNEFCTFHVICLCLWKETAGLDHILDIVIKLVTHRLFLSVCHLQEVYPNCIFLFSSDFAISSLACNLSLSWIMPPFLFFHALQSSSSTSWAPVSYRSGNSALI